MKQFHCLSALGIAIVGISLSAQESVGTLVGTVRDASGKPVTGVTLSLTGATMLGSRTITTGAQGEYRVPMLMPGQYTLRASKSGFLGQTASFRINAGQTLNQAFTLRIVETGQASVEIVADAATAVGIDKTDTKTATTIPFNILNELPVSNTAQGAVWLAPGTTTTAASGDDRPSMRGGFGGALNWTVNGISVRDNSERYGRQTPYVITDLIEDIAVIQSPLNAKYGNSSSGTVNVTTKSGSNLWTGSLRIGNSRNDWTALNQPRNMDVRFSYNNGNINPITNPATVQSDAHSRDYQFTLTGPIIKDHLTFSYGVTTTPTTATSIQIYNIMAYSYHNVSELTGGTYTGAVGSGAPATPGYTWGSTTTSGTTRYRQPGVRKDIVQQYKLFWQVNQNHQMELFYSMDNMGPYMTVDIAGVASGDNNLDGEFANFNQFSERSLVGLNYRGVIGGNGLIDFRIGRTKKVIQWTSGPYDPIIIRTFASGARSIADSISRSLSSYTWITNGNIGSGNPNLRQNDNASLNYTWTNGAHVVDVGVERLIEVGNFPVNRGPNDRTFYIPGRAPNVDGQARYWVYNFFASPFNPANYPGWDPAITVNNPAVLAINRAFPSLNWTSNFQGGTSYAAEMRTLASTGTPKNTQDYTDSVWINDIWTINSHWSVMAGLRFENWRVTNRLGTEVDSSDLAPRLQVKYDVNGDNQHLLSASYAQFRGTIGQNNLTSVFRRQNNNITYLNRWNVSPSTGDADAMYTVGIDSLLNPENYKRWSYSNSDIGNLVDPDLKPEVAKEIEVSYRLNFKRGGFFRASAIMRNYNDLWYRRGETDSNGVPILAPVVDPDGLAFFGSQTLVTTITVDPWSVRRHKSIELEWNVPVMRSEGNSIYMAGNWTMGRTKGRVAWGDGGSTVAARYDAIFAKAGYEFDNYNAYGDITQVGSNHNIIKNWLSWACGGKDAVKSNLAVTMIYEQGAPFTINWSPQLPSPTYSMDYIFPQGVGLPTTLAYFPNNKRGTYTNPDFYYFDLKWNVTIALKNKINLFSEVTVGNLFNQTMPSGINTSDDSTNIAPVAVNPNNTYRAMRFSQSSPQGQSLARYGTPSGWRGLRGFDFSFGIRF